MATPFMSPKTFLNWLFGWLAAFKIDFRKSIDPWCKHSPQIIAGDGTHIGVSVRNMKLQNPVTHADDPRCLKPNHKCNNRLLLPNKIHREHLRHLTRKMLKKLACSEEMDMNEEATKMNEMKCYNSLWSRSSIVSPSLCTENRRGRSSEMHGPDFVHDVW